MSNRSKSKKLNSLRKAVAQEHQRRNEVRVSQNESRPNGNSKPRRKTYDVRLIEVVYPEGEEHVDTRPFFKILIEGEVFRALFKTGSDVSVFGPKVTEKLKKYVIPTEDCLVSHKHPVPTAGWIKLKIDIGNDVKTFDFFAATEPVFHDIILGIDFCSAWPFGLGANDFSINNGPWQDFTKFLFKGTPIMTPQSIGSRENKYSPSRDSCFSDMETQSASSGSGSLNSNASSSGVKSENSERTEKIVVTGTEVLVDKVLLLMQKLEVFSIETQEAVLNAVFRDKQSVSDNLLV
ncbi:hypothetical protein QAD02_023413 [Eretmocerus hayati]|uniref:Uncharacterized protein n=1 Tax=Eretmocerus hayati TaxID=131215 RepID=A0ACC2PY83_9HYME|nr:hypothetical protein QAD02_023413 [Eretmocerus hayati]